MSLSLTADALIVGGGMAGGWAAIAAARAGASVILVDKGRFGTSGVTATAGPGHWWVPPDAEERERAVRERSLRGFGLADPAWMLRVIDQTWRTLPTLADHYDFPVDPAGVTQYRGLRGPEYLRALRRTAEACGVTILDHSPALELLLHRDGAVAGAAGIRRQAQNEPWTVRAAGVVLATGGVSFRSGLLGSRNNTGDGYLMAAEAGASLSGMEFSTFHTVSPIWSCQTRAASYSFATYFDEDGNEIADTRGPDNSRVLGRALLRGRVFCTLARTPEDLRRILPQVQPAVALDFARRGVDPFRDRFEVTLRGEGTVRGTGGLRIVDADCATEVPGLFAAGDAATRELVAGATSGGGAQNSAWALSSGIWSGRAAAALALRSGTRSTEAARPLGEAGLRPRRAGGGIDPAELVAAAQAEMLPFDKILFRTGGGLETSLDALDGVWQALRDDLAAGTDPLAAREGAALIACARWCSAAALARAESRGMHRREDAPTQDPACGHRLLVGGLDRLRSRPDLPAAIERVA